MKVIIVTGEINHGKTRYLQELVENLKLHGIQCTGFLSPGTINDQGFKDFEIQDLSSSEKMHLASRNAHPGYEKMNESFFFNPTAIKMGISILQNAIDNRADVLVIDEVGPIELREKVWYRALVEVLKNEIPVVILSVRKGLSQAVINKFYIRRYQEIDISETPVPVTVSMIHEELG